MLLTHKSQIGLLGSRLKRPAVVNAKPNLLVVRPYGVLPLGLFWTLSRFTLYQPHSTWSLRLPNIGISKCGPPSRRVCRKNAPSRASCQLIVAKNHFSERA